MTAPKEESVNLVQEWLQGQIPGAKMTMTGEYLTVEDSIDAIESLLKTTYHTYGKIAASRFCTHLTYFESEQGDKRTCASNTRV